MDERDGLINAAEMDVGDFNNPDDIPNNPDQVIGDSDEEAMSQASGDPVSDQSSAISDSLDSNEEPIADSGDNDSASIADSGDNDSASIADSEDANDFIEVANVINEIFHVNVEGDGLDELLVARHGRLEAWEAFILCIAKALEFRESYRSMLFTFRIFNAVLDNANFPQDMRGFWTLVNRNRNLFTNQVVCTVCWVVLNENGKEPVIACAHCGPGENNENLGSFLYIDLKSQLQGLLSRPGMAADLLYPYTRQKQNNEAMEDVYDGSEYRRHATGFLHRDNHNYSLALWADGVGPVKSSKVHIVPVFLQLLELSPRARQRHAMLAAMYVGPLEPNMGRFLLPITEQLHSLHVDGVTWRTDDNEERVSRFMLLLVSADSEMRYNIFGMMRHNGAHGCTFCEVDGEPNREAANNTRIYPVALDANSPERTDASIRRNAREAREADPGGAVPVRGVRGLSGLDPLAVDLRRLQLVETLHLFWEGVFPRCYGNTVNPHRANHIAPRNIALISERIKSIRTPTKLSRLPRGLENFKHFQGNEYRNNCLHYWLPCAHDLLSPEQLHLYSIFAEATFILNKDSILPAELDEAERLLNEFRQEFQNLFPREEWTYNIHLLKHAVRSVRELGPAWVASGFFFESLNRKVINYIKSPTDRAEQVACRMMLAHMVENYLDGPMNPIASGLLRDAIGKKTWEQRPDVAAGRFVIDDGVGSPGFFDERQIVTLTQVPFENFDRAVRITKFRKTTIHGVLYQVRSNRNTKYNNSIAYIDAPHLRGVDFIEIESIVTWQYGGIEQKGIFGTAFQTIERAFETSYMKIVEKLDGLVYVALDNVITPAVLVQVNERTYISRLSSRWVND